MFMKSLLAVIALTLAPLGASAQALVDASDVDILAALIQEEGYRAVVGTDGVGDPMITSAANGHKFTIFFYGCTEGLECRDVRFSTIFDLEKGMSLTRAQDFNYSERWVKVYMDEDSDPYLELDYNLYGGVSATNFKDTLDWWVIKMSDFIEYIDF
jgi:hypothetical protein